MLELVQDFVDHTRRPTTRSAAETMLASICETFGFASGVVFEYGAGLRSISDLIDSNPARRLLWAKMLDQQLVNGCVAMTTALSRTAAVSRFDASYFAQDKHCLKAAQALDMLEGVVVPIMHMSTLSGVAKFAGAPHLEPHELLSLHAAAYLMFTTLQSTRVTDKSVVHLTPREMEVMQKAARGHTTPEIAHFLGMSERTVNQHTDNVSAKLGTRNRVHSVASLMRMNLL